MNFKKKDKYEVDSFKQNKNQFFDFSRKEYKDIGVILDINFRISSNYLLILKFYNENMEEINSKNLILITENSYSLIEECYLFINQLEIKLQLLNKDIKYAKIYLINTTFNSYSENKINNKTQTYMINIFENENKEINNNLNNMESKNGIESILKELNNINQSLIEERNIIEKQREIINSKELKINSIISSFKKEMLLQSDKLLSEGSKILNNKLYDIKLKIKNIEDNLNNKIKILKERIEKKTLINEKNEKYKNDEEKKCLKEKIINFEKKKLILEDQVNELKLKIIKLNEEITNRSEKENKLQKKINKMEVIINEIKEKLKNQESENKDKVKEKINNENLQEIVIKNTKQKIKIKKNNKYYENFQNILYSYNKNNDDLIENMSKILNDLLINSFDLMKRFLYFLPYISFLISLYFFSKNILQNKSNNINLLFPYNKNKEHYFKNNDEINNYDSFIKIFVNYKNIELEYFCINKILIKNLILLEDFIIRDIDKNKNKDINLFFIYYFIILLHNRFSIKDDFINIDLNVYINKCYSFIIKFMFENNNQILNNQYLNRNLVNYILNTMLYGIKKKTDKKISYHGILSNLNFLFDLININFINEDINFLTVLIDLIINNKELIDSIFEILNILKNGDEIFKEITTRKIYIFLYILSNGIFEKKELFNSEYTQYLIQNIKDYLTFHKSNNFKIQEDNLLNMNIKLIDNYIIN